MQLKRYLKEAFSKLVLKRALRVALLVGIVLNLINQGRSIMSGFEDFHTAKFLLTFLVPYLVSTYSSVVSKFNFVSGEVSGFDAQITCNGCGKSSIEVQKGDLVPYCPGCETKTKWTLVKFLPPETLLEEDKTKSNALFAEFNPAPVIRVDKHGHILRANPTARMLFHIDKKENHITHYIDDLKELNFKDFIRSNRVKTFQIKINDDYYQLDLRAISDLEVFHIYASKNTQLIVERNQRILFQNAIEKTTDSVMITDTSGKIEYVNQAFEEHSGYSFDDIKGKNPSILNSGYQPPEIYKEMWETIEDGKIWKGLFRNKKKNGALYWERATITPVTENNGSISHYMAIKDDVTEELKLKDDLNSFALFAKHNPDPVMRFDADLKVIEANPAAVEILKTEQVIGENAAKLFLELKNINVKSLIENSQQKTIRIQVVEDYFNLVIKGIKELNLLHVYGSKITEQVKAEKVVESMALFAKLNPEPVFRFDSEFTIIDANPAATETFPELKIGNDIRKVIPNLSDLPINDFISGNQILKREESVNERIYRLKMRGVHQSNICVVYSSDITERVEQEKKISSQAEKIQSSIKYASNIQAAVLPNLNYVNEILPENMILNLPRDVVSGDFYWIKKVEESIVIAIADCTGHGVPGAFMSMLGVAFLNEIVKPGNLVANEILNKLREHVIKTLSNSESSRADGMDMSLCIIQPKNKIIQYSGANNPFVLINSEGLQMIKADKMPIGTYVKQDKPFTLHEIPYQTGDVVYLFSDGYQDQLGGEKLLKFGSKNFRALLQQIYNQNFNDQKERLVWELNEWTKTYQRIDDVLVMGFKLP